MNILLTNDDGYRSEGLQILKNKLSLKHNVYISAPSNQMSATSHAITLFKPMKIQKINEKEYALSGTPADCVKVALFYLYSDVRFDLVLSGINHGANMGDDIFYSGTVAGAREGSLNGIFSVAVSLNVRNEEGNFDFSSGFVSELIDKINPQLLKENLILNINIPNGADPAGMKLTHLGKRKYRDFVCYEEKGEDCFVTISGDDPGFENITGSDLNCVHDHFISVTPLINEVTDLGQRDRLQTLEKGPWACFSKK